MINTLESKIDRAGDNVIGDITAKRTITVHNTLTIDNNINQTNGTATLGNIDIYPYSNDKPKISFSTVDSIISDILEEEEGYLSLNQNPPYNDSSKRIVTTEWIKIYPLPFTYRLVDSDNNPYNIGSDNNPIYFKDGIPAITDNTLNKDISGNAATAIYAVDAGHAVNADHADNATKTDKSDYSVSADKFNKNGSITLSNVVVGSATFNGSSNININTTLGSGYYGFLPNYYQMSGVSTWYTATRPCWVFLDAGRGDERDPFNFRVYSSDGVCRLDDYIHYFWDDENKWGATIIPLNKGDTVHLFGGSKWTSVIALFTK